MDNQSQETIEVKVSVIDSAVNDTLKRVQGSDNVRDILEAAGELKAMCSIIPVGEIRTKIYSEFDKLIDRSHKLNETK